MMYMIGEMVQMAETRIQGGNRKKFANTRTK